VAVGFVQWETTIGRLVPGAALSRVTSLDWFVTVGLMPLGYALSGPVAAAVGLHATMIAASVVVAAMFLATLAVPDVRGVRQESVAS
jgi:DHA3 family tetracycline resistance protein-like MFS transporter